MRRFLVSIGLMGIFCAPAGHAAYTSTVAGNTAILIGDSTVTLDVLTFVASGGLLVHNRAADPGFNSEFDFDTTQAGDQTRPASAMTNIFVITGTGGDLVSIGGTVNAVAAPADALLASFTVSGTVTTALLVANSASVLDHAWFVTPTQIATDGVTVTHTQVGTRTLAGGSGNDVVAVSGTNSTSNQTDFTLGAGANSVTVGALGTLSGILTNIRVLGTGRATSLTIDDSSFTMPRSATLTALQFSSPGLGSVIWTNTALNSLTVRLGSGNDDLTVNGAPAAITSTLLGNGGADAMHVDGGQITSSATVLLFGGADNDTFDVIAGATAGVISIDGEAPTTLPGDTLNYSPAGGLVDGNRITSPGLQPVFFTNIETINGASLPTLTLATTAPSGTEAGGAFLLTVALSQAISQAATVEITRTGGTATPSTDFSTTFPILVTIPAGDTSASVPFTPLDDAIDEADETVSIALANPMNATIGVPSTGVITILDDDGTPAISITSVTQNEGDAGPSNFVFTISIPTASALNVSVDYATADGTATAGSDYTATSGTAMILAGATSTTISVPVLGDTTPEPSETFVVNLTNAMNAMIATPQGTGTITNDDGVPALSITDVTQSEGNAGTTTFTFTVSLSSTSGSTVTVDYATADGTATAGSDYTAASGTLTFNPGVTSQPVLVTVTGDTLAEADEMFVVNLTNPVNASIADAVGTGMITNDDGVPALSITDVTQTEGNVGTTVFTFTVSLPSPSGSTVTVDYATADGTATAGSDYTAASGTLTFNPGVTSQPVLVTVTGDTLAEADEMFVVNLTNPVNASIADAVGTGTITNDDTVSGPAPVPTMSEWALILLGMALAAIAAVKLR